jgi:nitrate reductase NapE component
MSGLMEVEAEVERKAEEVADKTGIPTAAVLGLFLLVVVLVIGGVGFCAWRFLRKRRLDKDKVKKAQDEQGLVDEAEEPDFLEEEPIKVTGMGGMRGRNGRYEGFWEMVIQ